MRYVIDHNYPPATIIPIYHYRRPDRAAAGFSRFTVCQFHPEAGGFGRPNRNGEILVKNYASPAFWYYISIRGVVKEVFEKQSPLS